MTESPRAPFGATVVLALTLAVAAFLVVMPVVMLAVPGTVLPAPFPEQHQRGETLCYLLAYAVLTPLALGGSRGGWPTGVHAGPHRAALPALTALLAAALAGALVAVKALGRLAGHDGVRVILAAAVVWWLLAGVVAWRLRSPSGLGALAGRVRWAGALAAAAVALVLLSFTLLASISLPGLAAGAVVGAGVVAAYGRVRIAAPARARLAIDLALVAVLMSLIPDLVIFQPERAARSVAAALNAGIIQFHHNLLLGPANEVLHGRPLLHGTASQYGVTSILALVAWFHVAPIGYGTFGLLAGAFAALWFGAGYAILRLAATPRWLSAGAMGVAVVVLALNLPFPIGAVPQDGPLRFGMPMLLVLCVVFAERRPDRRRLGDGLALAVVGLSSVWSFEALGFTALTFAALAVARARLQPAGTRMRSLVRDALAGGLACVVTHVLFAAIMLAATGHLPDWGRYLAYLREFLAGGKVGDLTYDVERWTVGFGVGAAYVASAIGVAELWRRRGASFDAERPALMAIVGMTAYGVALFSYYVNRSQGHILMHVALPALLLGALWLGLLLRSGGSLAARRTGLAGGLAVAILCFAVAWSAIGPRFGRTPLAHVIPGGPTLGAAVHRLWHTPPLNPNAPAGQRTLARYLPGERRSLMMVSPDLGTEVLLRSDRADALHLGDPWESSFALTEEVPVTRRAVDGLRAGRRMVMDGPARAVLATLSGPGRDRDVLADPLPQLAPLQEYALLRIMERFRLRPVARDGEFSVVELEPRG